MQVWTIRHKPTGAWMPSRVFRSSGGWSYWNPGYVHPQYGAEKPHDPNPRIFFTLQSARNSLTAWLAGEWRVDRGTTNNFESPEDYEDLVTDTPPMERKREDMEVVELSLTGGGL